MGSFGVTGVKRSFSPKPNLSLLNSLHNTQAYGGLHMLFWGQNQPGVTMGYSKAGGSFGVTWGFNETWTHAYSSARPSTTFYQSQVILMYGQFIFIFITFDR